jgi:hypothetical protein
MWFDKNHTLAKIEGWVWEQKVFQLPILRRLPRYFLPLMLKVIDYLAFGRFREGKPGASLKDPSGLFNSSLEGNTRRAIDLRAGEKIDEKALKALIKEAVALNESKAKR